MNWLSYKVRLYNLISEMSEDEQKTLLEELQRRNPSLYTEALFQERVAVVDRELADFNAQRADFSRMMKDLEEIQEAGFPADRPTGIFEGTAERWAHTDEDKLRLENWRTALREHESRTQSEADTRFTQLITQSATRLRKLSEIDPVTANDAYVREFESVDKDLHAAAMVAKVSKSLRDQLPPLQQKCQACAAKLEKAHQRLAKKRDMIGQIDSALPDLDNYRRRIEVFVKEFPDHPESAHYTEILAASRLTGDLTRCSNWPVDNNKAMITVADEVLSLEDKTSPWHDVMRHIAARSQLSGIKQKSLEFLQRLKENWRFYDLYSFTCTDHQKKTTRYYCRSAPEKTQSGVINGQKFYKVTAEVFTIEHQEEKIKFSTADYHVDVADDKAANLAEHCKILRRVLFEVQEADPLALGVILLRQAEELRQHSDVDAVAKVVLMESFLVQARQFVPEEHARIDKVITQLRKCNTNIYWLDSSPTDETVQQKKEIANALGKMAELTAIVRVARLRHRIYHECIRRRIECVGSVKAKGTGLRLDVRGNKPTEVWIATRNNRGECETWIASERTQSGDLAISPEMKNRLRVDQLLLAPGDGRRTRDILKSIMKDVGNMSVIDRQSITWPRSWPMNARSLNGAE